MDNAIVRGGDYLDRMRGIAVAALAAAAIAASIGSLLDWVVFTRHLSGSSTGGTLVPVQTERLSGIQAQDGWWVIGASVVILIAAALLMTRKKSFYGWLAFLSAGVMGTIVFADYREVGDLSDKLSLASGFEAEVATGLTMVAAAVIVAVIGSIVGIAASPRRDL